MDLNEALSRAEPDANTGAAGEFVIDSDLRTISIPAGFGSLGVESDDDVRRLKFRLPKMYGEFDLSEFDIRINYANAGGQTDIYLVDDKAVDGDSITFSWLAGRTATKYKGSTRFIVCLKKSGSDGVIQREFNTTVAALPVLEGLEGTGAVVQQNPDIVEEILKIKESFALADNLTTTEPGKALDARQGQLLNVAQTDINKTITNLSDRLADYPQTSIWLGQFGNYKNGVAFSFPAHICCIKYANNTCDIHISCVAEQLAGTGYAIFSGGALLSACRVKTLSYHVEQTAVTVYTPDGGLNSVALGRSGLSFNNDLSALCLGRHYGAGLTWGGWGMESGDGVYHTGWSYHIDIYGATYS